MTQIQKTEQTNKPLVTEFVKQRGFTYQLIKPVKKAQDRQKSSTVN